MASILGLEVHEAASTGDYDALEEFVSSGKYDLNLADEDWGNKTALHWACQRGRLLLCRVYQIRTEHDYTYVCLCLHAMWSVS